LNPITTGKPFDFASLLCPRRLLPYFGNGGFLAVLHETSVAPIPITKILKQQKLPGDERSGTGSLLGTRSFFSCRLGSFFAKCRARLFRQMRDRSLPLRGFSCFLDVSLCSDALFRGGHVLMNHLLANAHSGSDRDQPFTIVPPFGCKT
jgi:hypothetical protein